MVYGMYAKRGHPKNWRISEHWVTMWGGDWNEVLQEMEKERMYAILEDRRSRYIQLLETGYKCENDDHNACFRKLCMEGDCELDHLIPKQPGNEPPEVEVETVVVKTPNECTDDAQSCAST
jgi:hypothetical protein